MGQETSQQVVKALPVNTVYVYGCTVDTLDGVHGMARSTFLSNAKHIQLITGISHPKSTARTFHTKAVESAQAAIVAMHMVTSRREDDLYIAVLTTQAKSDQFVTYVCVNYGTRELTVRGLDIVKSNNAWDLLVNTTQIYLAHSIHVTLTELAMWIMDGVIPVGIYRNHN